MTRKIITLGLAGALVVGSLALPASAKKKKPKPSAPAPVATTVYLDGTTQAGEQEMANVPVARPGAYLKLAKEPGSGQKSMGVPDYAIGPNPTCAGNSLVPVFTGEIKGTIKGDMKITFEGVGTPGSSVEVRVWPDISAQACNDAYPAPAGAVEVALPQSQSAVEATIPGLDFTSVGSVMIQFTPVTGTSTSPQVPPSYGRIYYGTDVTKVEFQCVPSAGASTCI